MRSSAALAFAAMVLVSCSKPVPPTLTPKQATVTSITPLGLNLQLTFDATNPNAFALSAQQLTGTVSLAGHPLGTVSVPQAITLPPNATTTMQAAIAAQWLDLASVGQALVTGAQTIPYTVDGTVTVGGNSLNVALPYHMEGQITAADLKRAVGNSIGAINLAPAFNLLQQGGSGKPAALPSTPAKPR
jgi:LEA14-like dessication related protein